MNPEESTLPERLTELRRRWIAFKAAEREMLAEAMERFPPERRVTFQKGHMVERVDGHVIRWIQEAQEVHIRNDRTGMLRKLYITDILKGNLR